MDKAEAFALFMERKLHPHCPVDGHTGLQMFARTEEGQETWNHYRCKRCKETFKATVMHEPVDIRV